MSLDRLTSDQSSPPNDDVGGSLRCWYLDAGPPARTGTVRSCDVHEPGVWHLQLEGDAGEAFGLGLALPRACACPLRPGLRLHTRVRSEVLGIHPVLDACVIDAEGDELQLACSGHGAPDFAPGWTIEWGPRAGGSRGRADFWVRFARDGREAFVRGNEWRRLETEAGAWLLSAHAVGWEPGQPLPPDASSYLAYALLRL